MNRCFKRILSFTLCVVFCFCLSSCSNKNNNSTIDDSYLDGLEIGEKNIFVSLYEATLNQVEILTYGEVLETEDFSLTFTDYKNTDGWVLECELTLNNFTIDEGEKEKNIYLGMYSMSSNGTWDVIVSNYRDYYTWVILEDDYNWGDYTSRSSFELYDDQKKVVTIIVVDGNLYNIVYLK